MKKIESVAFVIGFVTTFSFGCVFIANAKISNEAQPTNVSKNIPDWNNNDVPMDEYTSDEIAEINRPDWKSNTPDWKLQEHISQKVKEVSSNRNQQPSKRNKYVSELHCLTKNIYHEAAYESVRGRQAVALVTMNRLKQKNKFKRTSVCGVVWAYKQFSWTLFPETWKIKDKSAYREAKEIAKDVLNGEVKDFTRGSTHYYNYHLVNPNWGKNGYDKRVIGNHVFMKLKNS